MGYTGITGDMEELSGPKYSSAKREDVGGVASTGRKIWKRLFTTGTITAPITSLITDSGYIELATGFTIGQWQRPTKLLVTISRMQ